MCLWFHNIVTVPWLPYMRVSRSSPFSSSSPWCSCLQGHGSVQSQHKDAIVVSMGGNPSGRSQTLLLATWLSCLLQQCSIAAQPENHVTNLELSHQSSSSGRGSLEQASPPAHTAAVIGGSRKSKAVASPQHSPRHLKLGSEVPAALWQGLPGTALGHALAFKHHQISGHIVACAYDSAAHTKSYCQFLVYELG